MGFRCRSLRLVASVLLCGPTVWAQNYETLRIRVLVNDSVGVNRGVLKQAEQEASWLFRSSGIIIDWSHCGKPVDCARPPHSDEFVLHIVASGKTTSDFVFGEAFLAPDGTGKYTDVFFDRMRETDADIDIGQLLGAVSAHELGHLLLGSHSHSLMGIMEPLWKREALHKIAMRNLTFTPEQLRLMRSRLQGTRVAITSLKGPSRLGLE
jgi:hypothetical protein